ncbi:hypothetical protein D9M72_635450 [compost metagenome]
MKIGPTTSTNIEQIFSTTNVPIATVKNGTPPSSIRMMVAIPFRVSIENENSIELNLLTMAFRKALISASIAFT